MLIPSKGRRFNELCDTMGKSTRTRPDAAKASAQQPARTPVQYPARESPVPAEDELRGPKFANSLAMRIRNLNADFVEWLSFFETNEEYFQWLDHLNQVPESEWEKTSNMVGFRALRCALDDLERPLAEAKFHYVRLKLLEERQNRFELEKQMFDCEVLAHCDAVDKVLELPVNMAQILKNNVREMEEQIAVDHADFARLMKETVVQATSDEFTRLKYEFSKGFKSDGVTQTVMTFQETRNISSKSIVHKQ